MDRTFSSPDIAKELKKRYCNGSQEINIKLHHEKTVRQFIMGIEKAHKKASKSKLVFD